ncbi:unnamed protein product [Spirodela intermedia]|uniref:Uncharacterized protein n=1 Tax=Spirodela intermedia TaxID=51605 RepID=A0A7I8IUD4_SPIIN|nr:unnamed protein product [Spirodela intermedia]CAA6661389.1 unnamed protein product [Spirodela intermedia]
MGMTSDGKEVEGGDGRRRQGGGKGEDGADGEEAERWQRGGRRGGRERGKRK